MRTAPERLTTTSPEPAGAYEMRLFADASFAQVLLAAACLASLGEIRDPQLGAVPRHPGGVPTDPRQAPSVGTDRQRARIEALEWNPGQLLKRVHIKHGERVAPADGNERATA